MHSKLKFDQNKMKQSNKSAKTILVHIFKVRYFVCVTIQRVNTNRSFSLKFQPDKNKKASIVMLNAVRAFCLGDILHVSVKTVQQSSSFRNHRKDWERIKGAPCWPQRGLQPWNRTFLFCFFELNSEWSCYYSFCDRCSECGACGVWHVMVKSIRDKD